MSISGPFSLFFNTLSDRLGRMTLPFCWMNDLFALLLGYCASSAITCTALSLVATNFVTTSKSERCKRYQDYQDHKNFFHFFILS